MHDESAAVQNADLREHVAKYHLGPLAHVHNGWHVHFVTIREFLRGGGFPVPDSGDERRPDEMPVVLSLSEVRPSTVVAATLPFQAPGDCAANLPTVVCIGDPGGSLTSGSSADTAVPPDRRLPLLCIARC